MLNFITTIIRPNIQYIINYLIKANKGPAKKHIVMLKHLWRYITGTKSLGFYTSGYQYISNLYLHIYGDTSFADDLFTRVSIGGYIVFLAGYPIIWKNQKQTIVTISIIEAEFINFTSTIFNIK